MWLQNIERRWSEGITSGLGPRWVYRRMRAPDQSLDVLGLSSPKSIGNKQQHEPNERQNSRPDDGRSQQRARS
jgi:hypothetical protein